MGNIRVVNLRTSTPADGEVLYKVGWEHQLLGNPLLYDL